MEALTAMEAEYEHVLKEIGKRSVELAVWTRRAEFLYVELLKEREKARVAAEHPPEESK